jgi:hypothetical protein
VRLVELRAQLRDSSAQEFELGALLVPQFDGPVPRLKSLSHQTVFADRRPAPARRAPAFSRRFGPRTRWYSAKDSKPERGEGIPGVKRYDKWIDSYSAKEHLELAAWWRSFTDASEAKKAPRTAGHARNQT